MQHPATNPTISSATREKASALFAAHRRTIYSHTDRLFAVLMSVQWVAGIAAALWLTPRTWMGVSSQTHIHVWAAIFLGGVINVLPIALALKRPGEASTRYAIAAGQMMMSALLIHLTGGRIETHFHVFGSLAFLAFYRDWRVLIPATLVVAADHFFRGLFWPESVYGVLSVSQWRWLEHAGWVLFEDAVLYVAIKRSVAEMWDIAVRTAQTNELNLGLEQRVADRTAEILSINEGLQKEIADRESVEAALKESEAQHRSIFDNATMGIYRSTAEGQLVKANGALATMLGYDSVEEILQCDLERDVYYFPEERAKLIAANQPKGGDVDDLEILWKKKDGSPIWVHLNARAVVDDNGKTVFFDACIHDVTNRVEAEHALLEANRRAITEYERLVERIATLGQTLGNARDLTTIFRSLRDFARVSVPCDGMVISLYEHEKEMRRPAYCWTDNTEFDPAELAEVPVGNGTTGEAISTGRVIIDNNFRPTLPTMDGPVVIGDCSENKTPRSALTAPMTVMGRTVGCVEVQSYQSSAYQPEHGEAMRMAANLVATAVDNVNLIEREQAKGDQLRQSQKMEAVGQLAGGVAHDFNNLLTAITGYSELTLREIGEDSPIRAKIFEIKKAGERAASLTRQLLAFSRKQILQPKVLDLNSVIFEMDKMLRRLIGEDIVLQTVTDKTLGQVKADPGQIEQIVMNLCLNARDAMANGGQVTIETGNLHLTQAYANQQVVLKPGHYVMLSVSDTGCGMDAATQAHIFEPFFTTKELGKGTGLGLSTVYGIVKQSEGTIWVYSEVDKGTSFKIYLPRVDEVSDTEQHGVATHALSNGNETILVVEDEEVVRLLTIEILEKQGYTVIAAANGQEGLRACREFEGRIDLMITDVVMPYMSGRELAERVAALRPNTQVLYMSGFTDDAIVRHGVLDEDVWFIQKPFSPDSLALKAREILDQANGKGNGFSPLGTSSQTFVPKQVVPSS